MKQSFAERNWSLRSNVFFVLNHMKRIRSAFHPIPPEKRFFNRKN